MTEEPMTADEINETLGLDSIEHVHFREPSGLICSPDFQREHALRLAVETFAGREATTFDVIFRAQKFYDFLTGKPT